MRDIAAGVVAGRQAPAVRPVTGPALGVLQAVMAVDQRMGARLLAVIGIGVAQPARVDAQKRVLRQEQRAAPVRPQRQRDAAIVAAIPEGRRHGPALVIGAGRDRVGQRARSKHEDGKRLVPAADRQRVWFEGPVGMVMPHHRAVLAQMRGPVDAVVKRLKAGDQFRFLGEKGRRPKDPQHQEGGLHQIAAIVAGGEGLHTAGGAVHEMRENPVEAVGLFQKTRQPGHAVQDLAPGAPAAFGSDDLRQKAKAGAAGGHGFLHVIAVSAGAAFAGHAADRVAPVQEIQRRRLRHAVAQRRIVKAPDRSGPGQFSPPQSSHVRSTVWVSRLFGPTCSPISPGSRTHSAVSSEGARG